MACSAAQDQCLARGNGLVHKERGVDLLFGAGKGEDDFRALVLIECEQVAADGLGALGLVDGVERALFLADKGSQCFFLFDHRHGNAPPDAFKIYRSYRSKKRGKRQAAEESKIISRRACQKKLTAIFNFVILIMDRNADDRVDQRRNFYHGYAAQGSRGRQGADRGAPCKDGRTEEKRRRALPRHPARRRA